MKPQFLVVDRTVSLVIELKDDSKLTFVEAIGLSTRSDSKALISSYVSLFESLWNQSELYHEIRESHEQLKTANQKLEINDKILNNFIQSAAHELRNPIQPILGLSQIIKSKITQKQEREINVDEISGLLDVVIRNTKNLQRLTDDVLDITRIETNSLYLKKEKFNLKELMKFLVGDYTSQNNFAKKNDSNNYRNIKLSFLPAITEDSQNASLFLIEADKRKVQK